VHEIANTMTNALKRNELISASREKLGGKLTILRPSLWNSEFGLWRRFTRFEIYPGAPFSLKHLESEEAHWIFIEEGSLVRLVDRLGVVGDMSTTSPRLPCTDPHPAKLNIKRGPRPKKLEQVKDTMRRDIREGRYTRATLRAMLEKNLAATYGVSRDTARKARVAILSEFVENSVLDK